MSTCSSEHAIASDSMRVHHVASIASPRFLTIKEVASRLSISVSSVWRHSKDNKAFPRPTQIGVRTTRWMLAEIKAYEVSRRLIH